MPSNPLPSPAQASGGITPGRNSGPAVEPSASATSIRLAKSDDGEVGPGITTPAATSVTAALPDGRNCVSALARRPHPKRPREPTVRHITARNKYRRESEAVVEFAVVVRAGRMYPDPTAEAAAPHVSLVLDVLTILRNSHSQKSAPTIDSLARVYALSLAETAPSQIRSRPAALASTGRSTSGSDPC
jgi:hypothetical protein